MFQTADQHLVDAVAVHLHYLHPPALDAHPLAFVRAVSYTHLTLPMSTHV